MIVAKLFTEPASLYQRVRTPLLALTGVLCAVVIIVLAAGLRSSSAPRLRRFLTGKDGFSSDHPVAEDKILREAPRASGGVFSLAFCVAAVGLALSLLVQLFIHTFAVSLTVIDTPPVDSGLTVAAIHYGTHTARLLLLGNAGSGNQTCPPVSVSADQLWEVEAVEYVSLSSRTPVEGFQLPPTLEDSNMPGCLVTAVCRDCRATVASSFSASFHWAYQSFALALSGRDAYDGCSPMFQRMFSAPGADRLLSAVTVDVDVRPVAVNCAGTMSASVPRAATGHDFVFSGASATYKADTSTLRPDTDTVTLTVNFAPTPYCSQVVITDAVDVLTVISGLAGLVSGLGGAFRALSRKWDTLGKRAVKVVSTRLPKAPTTSAAAAAAATKVSGASLAVEPAAGRRSRVFITNPLIDDLTDHPSTGTALRSASRAVGDAAFGGKQTFAAIPLIATPTSRTDVDARMRPSGEVC